MMIVPCVAVLLVGSFFAVVYLAIYRPLFSQPYPGEILDTIGVVANVRLTELELWVSKEMSDRITERLTPREQRIARRERRKIIAERLAPAESNARLCLASIGPEVRMLRGKPAGPRSERDRLMEELFEQAQYCCLLLTFAKVSRTLLPWDVDRMIRFHREVVLQEVRQLLLVFLRLTETYGHHYRENLLACLDCWELDEEHC
jgi:hypothetical protein